MTPTTIPATQVRFDRNAMMAQATLTTSDGTTSFVFCSIPGGRPWFTPNWQEGPRISISDAPQCDNHTDFQRFVIARFVDPVEVTS